MENLLIEGKSGGNKFSLVGLKLVKLLIIIKCIASNS